MADKETKIRSIQKTARVEIHSIDYIAAHLDETTTSRLEKVAVDADDILTGIMALDADDGEIFDELESRLHKIFKWLDDRDNEEGLK